MQEPGHDAPPLVGLYGQPDLILSRGDGCRVWDEEGREYLDFTAGIAVNALGHGSPVVKTAVQAALDTGLVHTSNLFKTRPSMELSRLLVDLSFPGKVFFCNSGAEANEAAIKFARRWAGAAGKPGQQDLISFRGAFHGRLMGTLALTDREAYQAPFRPLMPGTHTLEMGDLQAVEALLASGTVAAVFVEPIQGEGGVNPVDDGFLRSLRELCTQYGALLVFDEIQCGLGRTGSVFAHQTSGVVPDMMTLAKPLGGGLPIGAVVAAPAVADAMKPGDHGTTFGGGPLVTSVGLAVLREVSRPAFLARVTEAGARLADGLRSMAAQGLGGARQVRGRGLMLGLVLEGEAGPVVARAREAGLLVVGAGPDVVRFVPPLTVSDDEVELALERVRRALS